MDSGRDHESRSSLFDWNLPGVSFLTEGQEIAPGRCGRVQILGETRPDHGPPMLIPSDGDAKIGVVARQF